MTDIVRSMIRFSWAMSLFGARQATLMLSAIGAARSPRRIMTAFDTVSKAAEAELGEDLRETYRNGERWQQVMVDTVFGAIDPAVDLSRNLATQTVLRGSLTVFRQSASLLALTLPGDGRVIWRELGNKLEAFESFQYVDQILGFRDLDASSLSQQVEQAEGNGPYLRLWLTEGLGFAFGEAAWEEGEPKDLFRRSALASLPPESLIPLHTGMGLSLARHQLNALASGERSAVAEALERFAQLCQHNARDGYTLASYEALGLIIRQLAPEAAADVDQVLQREAEASGHREAFWHGFGRGSYFVATQAFPGSTGRAVLRIRDQIPPGKPQLNALSGLAWALTLVNFRQPEVVAGFLRQQLFEGAESEAVSAGIASAVLLWRDAVGEETHFEAFCGYPAPEDLASTWEQRVTEPFKRALADWPALKDGSGPGELFYYR